MRDYDRIPTSAEVVAVIRARHPELRVFGSFSDPDGRFNGGPGEQGRMETSYGFADCDYPLLAMKTTWDIDPDDEVAQNNLHTSYWLCTGRKSE